MRYYYLYVTMCLTLLWSCKSETKQKLKTHIHETAMQTQKYPTTGSILRLSPLFDRLIPKDAQIEIIAKGFAWSEGPVWISEHNMLLFSDIPPNKVFKWTEKDGQELYLQPSGYTGERRRGGEMGANGLVIDPEGHLILCQHGDRKMARMDAPLDKPQTKFITIVDQWQRKRFNSPNDAIFNKAGALLFTDPPYGLEKSMNDPLKEIAFQGVYQYDFTTKQVTLLTDTLSRPNGIAFSPDETKLYVSNSDPKQAIWMVYDYRHGKISNGKVFYDATAHTTTSKGLPDGLKVDNAGNIWATGPGGVWVFSESGAHLGTIKTGQATSNCAFNEDKSVLYITADMYLLRLRLKH